MVFSRIFQDLWEINSVWPYLNSVNIYQLWKICDVNVKLFFNNCVWYLISRYLCVLELIETVHKFWSHYWMRPSLKLGCMITRPERFCNLSKLDCIISRSATYLWSEVYVELPCKNHQNRLKHNSWMIYTYLTSKLISIPYPSPIGKKTPHFNDSTSCTW